MILFRLPYINDDNLKTIMTFKNLEDLSTNDERIVDLFKQSETLNTFRFLQCLDQSKIQVLPESVTTVINENYDTFNSIKEFLEKNPFVNEFNTDLLFVHDAVSLLDTFKHVKFNFCTIRRSIFTFKQAYFYLHPECKHQATPASEPDHLVYELLFQRLTDKSKLFEPYLKVASGRDYEYRDVECLSQAPSRMIDQVSSFNEFQLCLIKYLEIEKLDASNFERVFNKQIVLSNDDEYLRIIVSTYDEVFQLGANIELTVSKIKAMTEQEREIIKRECFFDHCRQKWIQPLTSEDLRVEEQEEDDDEY